jgi:hypothetical protein
MNCDGGLGDLIWSYTMKVENCEFFVCKLLLVNLLEDGEFVISSRYRVLEVRHNTPKRKTSTVLRVFVCIVPYV